MIVRDMFGNYLDEGGTVAFALSTGSFSFGRIDKISSGLDGQPPMAFVNLTIPIPIQPNGLLPGVINITVEEDKKIIG